MTRSFWLARRTERVLMLLLTLGCQGDPLRPTQNGELADAVSLTITPTGDFSDDAGKTWRQPILTTSLSWNQVAQVCPLDGLTPCVGVVAGKDLSGWVWASATQVIQMMSLFDPAILTSPTMSVNSVFAGIGFVSVFRPTQWFANTYSSSEWVNGWTSSKDAAGQPLAGSGGWSTPPHAGGIGVGVGANADFASTSRGVFLWKADGSDGRGMVANDDSGSVNSPDGGVAVANILINDSLASATATVSEVTISPLTSSSPSVTIDPTDGSVDVAYGTPAGSATLSYRVCETTNPSNCDTATVAVTIAGNIITATDDAGTAWTSGGVAVLDVRGNDQFGVAATLSLISSSDVGVSLDVADGSVHVAPGTLAGTKSLVYRLCESASPTNCDQATVTVTVANLLVDAVDDQGSAPSSTGGVAIGSVLVNDRLQGALATLANVNLAMVSSSASGVTLDLSDGSVDVASVTPSGVYTLSYQICEKAVPGNCDQASVSVTVAPQSLVLSRSSFTIKEGGGGSLTVRLSQVPIGSVAVTVAFYAGTTTLLATPVSLLFTAANWNTPLPLTIKAPKDSDKNDNAGTVNLSAAGVATASVVVKVTDINRSVSNPTATIAAPFNGQTVSGLVDFYGTGAVPSGTMLDGKFSVDGVRIYTDTNSSGSYRVAGQWNTNTVPNGWHTLELRVTDAAGKDGRMTITVLVNN